MDNNKETNSIYGFSIKDLFKSNPLSIILVYLITYIFGTILVSFIVCAIVGNISGYTFKETYSIVMGGINSDMLDSDLVLYYKSQAYINFFGYMLMFLLVPIFALKYLKDDLKIFKSWKNVLLIIGEAIVFTLVAIGVNDLADLIINNLGYENLTSQNETLIENMMYYSNKALIVISTVVFAPLVEELVYRKSVIMLCDRALKKFSEKHKIITIIIDLCVSAIIFALPHMLSSTNYNPLVWFILFSVYFISGLGLAIIFYFTNKNIYASTIAHMSNNLVAILRMF